MKKRKKKMVKRTKVAMMKKRRRKMMTPKIQNQLLLNVPLPLPLRSLISLSSNVDAVGAKSHSCPAEKHHFDECAARVAHAQEHPDQHPHGHAEDCAEEFLHLMHCVDKTIAVPLFNQLK
jgi:Ubiquinol-cytochrome C reductase hinge protein